VQELSDFTFMTYFLECFTRGVIKNHDDQDICFAMLEATSAAGTLVIVDGRTEFMAKYSELFYDLRDTGFSFFIYDHRGQGESCRLLSDPQKGHVEHFDDYIDDLHLLLNVVVKSKSPGPIYLLSHSMGGPISVLHEWKYPGLVDGMILCSPMFSINTSPFPQVLAKHISRMLVAAGFGTRYVFGGSPYNHSLAFANNDLTESPERFELNKKLVAENPMVALGSPTFLWLAEAFSAIDRIQKAATALWIPLLAMVSVRDTVVGHKAAREFCRIQPNCSLINLPDGKHELLMEKDQVRDVVLQHIRDFFSTNRSRKYGENPR
jgi:lysophospholipase